MENEIKPRGHWVIKANGERELFDEEKLKDSLRHAGAEEDAILTIVESIVSELRDGVSTQKIYRHAFALLKKERGEVAARYSLRRAIRELGPSGFPFERYVGEMLKAKGYSVQVGVIVQGWCVDHEVDVSARKDGTHTLIECKFHNEEGFKTDLKVALYVKERFQDIEKRHTTIKGSDERFHEAWLITNTKFTSKAIQYAECAGLTLIGWSYPVKGNLRDLINETRLQPVTMLTSLSATDKRRLMENDIVLCRDIPGKEGILHGLGIDGKKLLRVLGEIEILQSTIPKTPHDPIHTV